MAAIRSALEDVIQVDERFLKSEAISLFWTQKELQNATNEIYSSKKLWGYCLSEGL